MRKIDSIISEQKRRLLRRVSMSSQHQVSRLRLLSAPRDGDVCPSLAAFFHFITFPNNSSFQF